MFHLQYYEYIWYVWIHDLGSKAILFKDYLGLTKLASWDLISHYTSRHCLLSVLTQSSVDTQGQTQTWVYVKPDPESSFGVEYE